MLSGTLSMMRIGVLTYDYLPPIGGMGVVVKEYRDRILRLFPEHSIVILSPAPEADDTVSRIAATRFGKPGGCPLFSFFLFLRLEHLIRKHALDVLHVHSGSGGVFLLRKPSIPTVVTAHHTYRQEAAIVFRSRPLKRFRKYLMGYIERRTYLLADKITCVSKSTAHALMDEYGIDAAKITTIENAVPEGAAKGESESIEKRISSILYVGRLEERKGIWTLLQAFSILSEEMPEAVLRLVGENLLGKTIESWIRQHGLLEKVKVLGRVHDPYRFREMREATVVVVPSILEGFGLTAAEAMAVGACVVASTAPGLKYLIRDGETGLQFPSLDSEALSRVLQRALKDDALRRKLGAAAKNETILRFAPEDRTRDLEKVLRETYQRRSTDLR